MRYELTQRFFFEAAHTLRREIDVEPSRRFHGHTYIAEVTIVGLPNPDTGMVVDLGHLRAAIETVRSRLDHHLLDEVEGIGHPTLENLCAYIWRGLSDDRWQLDHVVVRREASGDACCLRESERDAGAARRIEESRASAAAATVLERVAAGASEPAAVRGRPGPTSNS
jgi:6-pyruvoyltetrahydropterin/6-carboxytetrahydropterin synthase